MTNFDSIYDRQMQHLAGLHFQAFQVCKALDVDAQTLTNIIHKGGVELCSERPNRKGVVREFCIIDIYIIAIFRQINNIIGRYIETRKILDTMFFEEMRQKLISGHPNFQTMKQYKEALCNNPYLAPHMIYPRNPDNPHYIVIDDGSCDHYTHTRLEELVDGMDYYNITVINVTNTLIDIDRSLIEQLGVSRDNLGSEFDERQRKHAETIVFEALAKGLSEGKLDED